MTPPLFDRADLLALLHKRVSGFQAGYRQNLALIGPAGRGKSALIRRFLQEETQPGSLILPLYLEVSAEEEVYEWIGRFLRTVLYAVLQLKKMDSFPTRLPELLEVCEGLVPRTAALGSRVAGLAEGGRLDEAYDCIWDLSHLLTQETGHRVLLVLDEFHRLRGLAVREPFHSLGRKIMVQPTTLYLLASSEPAVACSILGEGLALLFGKFESIEVPPLAAAACRKAIRSIRPDQPMDPWLEYLLMDLAQGEPHRLNLLLEALGRLPRDAEPGDSDHAALQLLEVLFLDPDSSLRREFENRLRLLPAQRNRMLCVQILEIVASGVHRLPQIAEQAQKPAAPVSRALQLLQEGRLLKKEGAFYRIPEQLLQAWLITAYPILQGVALMGPVQAQAHFRRAVRAWMEKTRQAAGRPMEEQLHQLLLRWSDEVVELDGHRTLLPKFQRVERVPGPLDRVSLLARPVKRQKSGWWVVPWLGPLDEGQARQLVQELRGFVPLRKYRKVLVGAFPAEVNARLVLQEAKVRLWDLSLFNQMLELYGLARLPVPEGAEDRLAQTICLQEEAPLQKSGEHSSEVAG